MDIFEKNKFSVTKVIETGTNFERINLIELNVNGSPIISLVYYYANEINRPKDEMIVHFMYSDILEYDFDCATEIIQFFNDYIGCVTESAKSTRFTHNLFYHMINEMWLVSDTYLKALDLEACDYYPKSYTVFQYLKQTDEITRKIKVEIH